MRQQENTSRIKKNGFIVSAILSSVCLMYCITGCSVSKSQPTDFGKQELKASTAPVHPGKPGEVPFWNTFAKRFIYAPAFDFKPVENAVKYRYEVTSLPTSKNFTFEDKLPYAALSPIWAELPVGHFTVKVTGLSANGQAVGTAGEGKYYRAATFNGPYLKPEMPYDQSAMWALDRIMYKDYVEYWLQHKKPEPNYKYYMYPAKIMGSLIVATVIYAQNKTGKDTVDRAVQIGKIIADYLISQSFPESDALAYFPPTYGGSRVDKNPESQMRKDNYMSIAAAESGHAYLDLYSLTKDEKYLEAAKRIAQTYLKTQLPNGSWYLYLDRKTGKPTDDKVAVPTAMINYFDRLRTEFSVPGLEASTKKAVDWVMQNPVKDFHWLAQFEDVDSRKYEPYERLSREQACDMAMYLLRRKENVALAEELIRFSEDQFVIWEQPEDIMIKSGGGIIIRPPYDEKSRQNPGRYSKNWLPPSAQEQYGFWMPVARTTGIMIDTYMLAYKVTGKEIYKAKAVSFANNFTRVQKLHDGDYSTYFTKYDVGFWINNAIYPAKIMMQLAKDLDKEK